jgi:hypothetical protein
MPVVGIKTYRSSFVFISAIRALLTDTHEDFSLKLVTVWQGSLFREGAALAGCMAGWLAAWPGRPTLWRRLRRRPVANRKIGSAWKNERAVGPRTFLSGL